MANIAPLQFFDAPQVAVFADAVQSAYGKSGNITEQDQTWDFLLNGNADVASNPSSPFTIDVARRAYDFADGNMVKATQDPVLQSGQALPGDQLIMVGAVAVLAWLPDEVEAAGAIAAKSLNQLARAKLVARNGANKRTELSLHTLLSSGFSGQTQGSAEPDSAGIYQTSIFRRVSPFMFGQAQRLNLELLHDVEAWAFQEGEEDDVLMRVRIHFACLIGQKS